MAAALCAGNAIAYKTTVSMSNMPGPQFPLTFLECPVERMFFFVSPQGTVGIFVTIFTFDGKVAVSISADSSLLDAEEADEVDDHMVARMSSCL